MSFLFCIFDVLLTAIMLFDTLGLIYQFRKSQESVDSKDYIRICFSWVLYYIICSLFSCSWKGVIGTLIRLIILLAKIYVTIPKIGGTNTIFKYLIEDKKGEEYYTKISEFVKAKLCKCCEGSDSRKTCSSTNCQSETMEPENPPETTE